MSRAKILDVNAVAGKSIKLSNYNYLLAYHASRVVDEESIRVHGLKPYTQTEALEDAVRKLEDCHVGRNRIFSVFSSHWDEVFASSPPRVWLMLNTKEFLDESTQYLIYGSEFLNGLAMKLRCRETLSKIGKPVIVKCAIPISEIPACWLKNLEEDIETRNTDNRAIAVSCVAPECIIDILHPTGYVPDPYFYGTKFNLG